MFLPRIMPATGVAHFAIKGTKGENVRARKRGQKNALGGKKGMRGDRRWIYLKMAKRRNTIGS